MRITIPGRPQARHRDSQGRLLDAAKDYLHAVRQAASATTPHPIAGSVRLDLHFVYTAPKLIPIADWPRSSIPNADTAQNLALRALTGTLVHHATQFNPLTVTRTQLTPAECQALHGCSDGATIITWSAE